MGYKSRLSVWSAINFRQIITGINGKMTRAEAVDADENNRIDEQEIENIVNRLFHVSKVLQIQGKWTGIRE